MMTLVIKKKSIFLFPLIFISFMLISILLNRGLITNTSDGFLNQIDAVSSDNELGSLSLVHSIRYYLLYPFMLFDNSIYQSLIFFLYVCPLFFCKSHSLKSFGIVFLVFSFFFSYRTVLVMLSIYILVSHIVLFPRNKKIILYSALLSFLSTGCFLAYTIIFYFFKNNFVADKRKRKYLTALVIILIFGMSGSLLHKILFFSDPSNFGSASNVSIESLTKIDFNLLTSILDNMTERSIVLQSIIDPEKASRLYPILLEFTFIIVSLFLRKDKISMIFLVLFIIGGFMEGLMMYSLLPSALFLLLDSLKKKLRYTRTRFSI
ncbi:hypothetical protein M0I35_RS17835 [Providencia rettgeri]|nr:hypothetical protein [Providencia rettgeri]